MTDNTQTDPLDILFVDERQSVDREILATAIVPFVRIFIDQGMVYIDFTKEGNSLTNKEKLLVHLLARKAIHLKDKGLLPNEAITPKEIETATGIVGNTLRPLLLQLKKDRLVQTDKSSDEGGYYVPNYALDQISEMLKRKKG